MSPVPDSSEGPVPDGSEPTEATDRPRRIRYGSDANQFGDLYRPDANRFGRSGPAVVVLLHGGFWRARYGLDLMEPLAADLVGRGLAVWNLEYRRVGQPGGGVPGTLDDVAAGIDALASVPGPALDLTRVALVGHSAGGHLALWAGARTDPMIDPVVVVGLAAVCDLSRGAEEELGDDGAAVTNFTGGTPTERPEAYRLADPGLGTERLPGGRVVLVHGVDDQVVPVAHTVDASVGSAAEAIVVDGADHFDVIDPASAAWAVTVECLERRLGGQRLGPGRSAS